MRRLLLLRHAKSAWPDGAPDLDRPLAARGRAAAPRMAEYLKAEGLAADLVLVSPARRTRETWDLMSKNLGETTMRFEPRLYEASEEGLLAVVRETDDSRRSLLLIGHNPGFEDLARLLIGQSDRDAFAHLSQKFPTAALAVIDFPVERWSAVAPRTGRLERFVTPKSLGGEDD